MADPLNFKPNGKFALGNKISGRPRNPGSTLGEILDGLMKEKGWTTRDLEEETRKDGAGGCVYHQHISQIIRGNRIPGERVLNRLLLPFGYRAYQELRVEPIEKMEEGK